ncbi:nucleoprotein [Serbia mononega-like virus 1]|uniref:Nucleoprotein n=1 Tax=Serbia mononega-like virus 1 TaxID=2771455 RepID=A0A7H1C8Z2_9MONO|nr:nucleoprotein [Serbia mononega-like virus 1]
MVLEYKKDNHESFVGVKNAIFKAKVEEGATVRDKILVGEKLHFLHYYQGEGDESDIYYVTEAMKDLLGRSSGIDAKADKINELAFVVSSVPYAPRHIFSFNNLELAIKEYFKVGGTRKLDIKYSLKAKTKGFNLMAVLAPLTILPNFADCMTEYSFNKDAGVEYLTVAVTEFADYLESGVTSTSEAVSFNIDEWKVLAFTIIFCFNKTADLANLTTAIKNRLNAIKNAGHLRYDTARFLEKIDIASFVTLSTEMADYPKLKTAIYSYMLANSDPICRHLAIVLKNANLSAFSAVVAFLGADQLTKLHLHSSIMREWHLFIAKKEKLIEQYGELGLIYHKLICPDDTTAMTTDIPMLTAAGKLWCRQNGMSTLANLKIKQDKYPPIYDQLVQDILPQKYQAQAMDLQLFKNLVKGCGLKLANLSDADWLDLFNTVV